MLTESGRISIDGGGVPFYFDFPIFDLGFSGPNYYDNYLTFFLRKLFYRLNCFISSSKNS